MNLESPKGSVRRQRLDSEEAGQENGRVGGHKSKNSSLQGEDDETDIPFDKGWAWMICLSCFIIFYIYAGYEQAVSVLLVDIMRDLDMTVSVVSIMFSVITCFYCLSTQLTNNLLLNHVTNRCLQTVAAAVNVLATLMFVIHPNSTLFLIAAFIKAAAKGTSLVSTMTMVGHYFKRRRALAVALGSMGGSVCSISVPPLTRYLRDEYGLRGCFLLVAGLEMHAVMATMILRPINSYRIRKLQVREGVNGGINKEEKRLLLSKTIQEVNSSSPITINETTESRSLEVQPLKDCSLETIGDRIDKIECSPQTPLEAHITGAQISGKQNIETPNIHSKLPDKHIADKDYISTLMRNLQSNDTNTFDTGSLVINTPGIQTNDTRTHDMQAKDMQCPDTQTPGQDDAKIIIVGKDHRNPSLTQSFSSRWKSASSPINGSDLDIQAIAEENVPTVNQSFKETKTGVFWKMTSWIRVIINFSLLKNYLCLSIVFIYCLINGGILSMAYLPSYARHVGIVSQDAAILMTILGACDMAARILSGYFMDLKIVKVYTIMGVSIIISGVVSQCLGLFLTFELLTFYVVIQGLIGSFGASLDMVLIVETLGIDYFSKVLPMCSLFLNVSIATQQLIVGSLIEYTKNYVVAFQYVGCMYLLSSILLLGLPIVRRLQQKKENNN